MASLRKVCALPATEIAVAESAIAGVVEHQGYQAVRALPGIGPMLGVAEIGDITRFPHPAPAVLVGCADPPPP